MLQQSLYTLSSKFMGFPSNKNTAQRRKREEEEERERRKKQCMKIIMERHTANDDKKQIMPEQKYSFCSARYALY